MLDHMFRRRALVYYDNSAGPIHVSGHASQEEQKLILRLVKPKYFIPVHGEYRHLFRHAALAHQLGCVSEEILLLENGKCDRVHGGRGRTGAIRCQRDECWWIRDRWKRLKSWWCATGNTCRKRAW